MIRRLRPGTNGQSPSDFFGEPSTSFPFRRVLSLASLVTFWEQARASSHPAAVAMADEVLSALERAPALREPISDVAVLEEHREVVDRLMSAAFPWAYWRRDIAAAFPPYLLSTFYATPRFEELFLSDEREVLMRHRASPASYEVARGLTTYLHIARHFFGVEIDFAYPLIVTTRERANGLERHFKLTFDTRFADVRVVGELPVLDEAQRRRLIASVDDLDVWRELIPPELFEMHGFTVVMATEVTEQEEAGALKRDLVDSDAITSRESFMRLQQRVRNLLKLPELMLGLAAIDGDHVLLVNQGAYPGVSPADCIIGSSMRLDRKLFAGSRFERAMLSGATEIIHDLESDEVNGPIERIPLSEGYRNVALIPLTFEEKVIGMLGLWSRSPGDLTRLTTIRLGEILPLFSIAIRRSMADLDNRVQRIIRQEYTSIHPTVEWRFREAAMRALERHERNEAAVLEPIVFEGVHPLYAQTDIRGSSTQRNEAIRQDLATQLQHARRVVESAYAARPLPVLENLAYRIDRYIGGLERGLGSGDEASVLDFLAREVEALFDHVGGFSAAVGERIAAYRASIDSELGFVFERRRAFEESVAAINRALAAFVDEEEERAQGMFPHYFEKHQTDGIDISMYVGASLVAGREYHPIYLRNLRLWQLVLLCSLARLSESLRPQLPVPLETTHLVLAQDAPLSIRFRPDEKQFDVDGAYNIRYEIMKKRIDKATVRGTGERLTQPGHIAIVFAQPREAAEYREYIEFLQGTGLLLPRVEMLELDELQGVQGLRALRVGVVLTADESSAAFERIVGAAGIVAGVLDGAATDSGTVREPLRAGARS